MKRLQYILLCGLLLLAAACEKDTLPMNFSPALTTGEASDIYRVGATLSGTIQKSDGVVVQDYGFLISELQSMAEYTEIKTTSTESTFDVMVQNLEPGKKYYYCAYANSGYSVARGEIKEFSTTDSNAPVFSELLVDGKDEKSFTVAATILDEGGSDLILCGFCWKLAENGAADPTVEDRVSNVSAQSSAISARIKDLTPNKNYLVRAYGINAKGVGYGKTLAIATNSATVPAVSSITAMDSTVLSVSVKASILSAGESTITEIGFCWSAESQEPTTANYKYDATGQMGHSEFTYNIENLIPETTYYVRAYAVNGQGTGYGDVYKFTAKKPTEPGIYSLQDLIDFRDAIINGTTDLSIWQNKNGIIKLFADIDLTRSEGEWVGIPNLDASSVFDGNGHTVKIKKTTVSDEYEKWGFFIKNNGKISNLTIDLSVRFISETNGVKEIGAVACMNDGTIDNCKSVLDVDCTNTFVGGIVGTNSGTVSNCVAQGQIITDILSAGICVENKGKVLICRNNASLTNMSNGGDCLGGIVGYNSRGTVDGCINAGSIVTLYSGSYGISGVVARLFSGTVTNCTNNGTITGSDYVKSVGGIVGNAVEVRDGEEDFDVRLISGNRNTGNVTGPQGLTGGICGILGGTKSTFNSNTNSGTVNGAIGADGNAIGNDERTQ